VLKLNNKSVQFVHEMMNGETTELLALCELTGVHMDRAARKAVAFPPDVREKIAAAVAPQA
jgi:acyl-CoA thioester hydrolase